MALCISLLFIGVKHPQAEMKDIYQSEDHWMWPTDGVITDTYGTRNGRHHGIDIAGGYGNDIYSVDEGIVTKSYYSNSYGHVVFVKHPSNLETVYAHLSKRNVQEGQQVNRGQVIGKMGSTGRSSGVHLHFEIHKNEWTVNKENALNPAKLLGRIEVGENVEAMVEDKEIEQVAGVMEIAYPSSTLLRYLPDEDLELITGKIGNANDQVIQNEEVISQEEEEIIHIVETGDNLWDIAEQYHSTVEELMEMNQLDSDLIHPEQELVIE